MQSGCRFMAVVAQFGRNRQTVGNDDQRHGNIKEFAEVVIQLARFEALEIFGFGNADDLDLIGMDKIQMADQRQNGFVGLYSDAVVRTRIACRPSKLELVLIIGKQAGGPIYWAFFTLLPEVCAPPRQRLRTSRLHGRLFARICPPVWTRLPNARWSHFPAPAK